MIGVKVDQEGSCFCRFQGRRDSYRKGRAAQSQTARSQCHQLLKKRKKIYPRETERRRDLNGQRFEKYLDGVDAKGEDMNGRNRGVTQYADDMEDVMHDLSTEMQQTAPSVP